MGLIGAVQVARIPRAVGINTGVNDTVTGRSVTARRPWAISGVCRCAPAMLYARAEPMTSEASRSTLAARPAPEVPLTATTVTVGSTSPAATAGTRASSAEVG